MSPLMSVETGHTCAAAKASIIIAGTRFCILFLSLGHDNEEQGREASERWLTRTQQTPCLSPTSISTSTLPMPRRPFVKSSEGFAHQTLLDSSTTASRRVQPQPLAPHWEIPGCVDQSDKRPAGYYSLSANKGLRLHAGTRTVWKHRASKGETVVRWRARHDWLSEGEAFACRRTIPVRSVAG